ncbi:hypothetical protein [Winogradskyella sp. UBA3174]|uniref:hypothetical protein n=1 Tax=Winogradskyella sp. UBA3174 TaxID=1947785 RepID=UPI0025D8B59A|nr:hypothetical protein [Winogradskyella sp. UBA3174]|tara:strand:+ start:7744 stop:8196 length:453 start_codon:yes stop_codon:yes gene_type:complete
MKKIVCIIVCALFTTYGIAQNKQTQKASFQLSYNNLKSLVQSKAYKFTGNFVYNNKNREKLENNTNTIVVNRNEASCNITSLSFENKKIETNGPMQNYNVKFDDEKQAIAINFKIGNNEIYLDIKPNGNTFLTAKSSVINIMQVGELIKL